MEVDMRPKLSTSPELFWKKVSPPNERGCRLWTGSQFDDGYGSLKSENGRSLIRAHRKAWEFTYGPIPDGMKVCHTCDVHLCCEPTHFFLGTTADNNADMMAKGRQRFPGPINPAKGERNTRTKLTDRQVSDIRTRYALGGATQSALANEYGVVKATIQLIVSGHSRTDSPGLDSPPPDHRSTWDRTGTHNPNVKLTDEQVASIRQRYAAGGISQTALALEFGVIQPHISRLVRGHQRN
jgi:hypothetical protein